MLGRRPPGSHLTEHRIAGVNSRRSNSARTDGREAGLGNRFGIIYVDFDTLERTPKLSAEWFREAARQNAVF